MSWWIFIHCYLWQNSLRRWWEQPLSLLSKLVVAGLLGLLGAFVILGIKELGSELDRRINDRETLAALITEAVPPEYAPGVLSDGVLNDGPWKSFGGDLVMFLQAAAFADLENNVRVGVVAVENIELHGLVDDFYLFRDNFTEGQIVEFEINSYRSEAQTKHPSKDMRFLFQNRPILLGGVERLAGILSKGFTKNMVLHAKSIDEIQKIHDVVDVLSRVEGKRVMIHSNLRILQELGKIREIQAQSLVWVTVGSGGVLGLVFGSLAWMEFREERYLLSLIRSFGVGRRNLLLHALMENCLLAVLGVLCGFGVLQLGISQLNLVALKMTWLKSTAALYQGEGQWLLVGALVGGILACIPIAVGLRKPLGLVLK